MKNKLLPIGFFISVFLLLYLISVSFPGEEIRIFINQTGIFAPIVFILILLITLIIAPFSGTPIMYAGYFAFGQKVVVLATIATWVSFIINFWIARKWGRKIVEKLIGRENIAKVDKLTKNYGIVTLIFLRIFQASVGDFVSFAAGLTNMKFTSYFLTSIFASIPGTLLWYYLSLKVKTPTSFTLLMLGFTLTLSSLFVLGSMLWKRLKRS